MIESQQALISDFITQAFGLPIAHENQHYDPTAGTPWVRLIVAPGQTDPGTVDALNLEQQGFMQFTLNYPEGEGAMTAKLKAQAIFDAYPLSRRVSYSGKSVTVIATHQFSTSPQGGWFQVVGRIFYESN